VTAGLGNCKYVCIQTKNEISDRRGFGGVSILYRCVIFCRENNKIIARRIEIVDANTKQYRRYNAVGRQLTVRLISPADNTNAVAHYLASVNISMSTRYAI